MHEGYLIVKLPYGFMAFWVIITGSLCYKLEDEGVSESPSGIIGNIT